MNRFKTKLVGLGIAAGMLAFPLGVGAASVGEYSNHRHLTAEAVGRAQYDLTANYMMIERSPLEQIAGRDNLDSETIRFLEDNLWDHDIRAYIAEKDVDNRLTQEEIKFLEDNVWDYDSVASYAELEPDFLSEEEFWFLEENSWDHDDIVVPEEDPPLPENWRDPYFDDHGQDRDSGADFAGDADNTGIGVYAIDPDAFSEEILWQDDFEATATFEGDRDDNVYPYPHDVPGLRAGELNY